MLESTADRRFGADALARARRRLEQRLGNSRVLVDAEVCAPFAGDESQLQGSVPDLVVLAETGDELSATLEIAMQEGIPVTPRAGGTGKSGGAIAVEGGIVLVTLGMNTIKDIDKREGIAVVEPGVVLADLQRAVREQGWYYPPDPASLESCALGGNVAENAGGARSFKYGVTGNYVLGIEAFLMGGARVNVGRRTRKGVTGLDLTSLLVGSEGTLAVFGDITLKLIAPAAETVTLVALFSDASRAASSVSDITGSGLQPACIELLDATTLQAMRDAGNSIDERAGAMLFIEVDGLARSCAGEADRIGDVCLHAGALQVLVARDQEERQRLWAARRSMSPAIKRLSRFKLSEDVVVPRDKIPALLDCTGRYCDEQGVRWLAYGHAGDGNLHVNFLWDDPDQRRHIDGAAEQLFRDAVLLGGSLSGEHGIGLLKAPYLSIEQSGTLIELQRNLKAVFDPANLLNPGKIFPRSGHGSC